MFAGQHSLAYPDIEEAPSQLPPHSAPSHVRVAGAVLTEYALYTVYALHDDQAPCTHGLHTPFTTQHSVLQLLDSDAGHGVPSLAAFVLTTTDRDCSPEPHVKEQEL